MDDHHAAAMHFAILIGIDAYHNAPLTSCVRDIKRIQGCLADKLESVYFETLTASTSPNSNLVVLEDPECLPTYRNVKSVFEKVTSRAKPGDFVYIHYSGHGTRMKPSFDFSNLSTGDLALVLIKNDQSPEGYLRGPVLARLLKDMVDKEMVVTLVLDCCFSATVYRNSDASVRYLPYDSAAASGHSSDLAESLLGDDALPANRDASMRDNWLLEPDRYAILAACGPNENAKGGFETSSESLAYGALSCFLWQTLDVHGLERRHKDIYRHICARFWEYPRTQHPVLYGNANQGFFGHPSTHYRARVIRVVKREGSLWLLAGNAHGFHNGDLFAVSPCESISAYGAEEQSNAKIVSIGALVSRLELTSTQRNLGTEAIAEPLKYAYLAKFPIQLASDLPQHDEWLAALKERSLGINADSHRASALQVVLNSSDEYEILDCSGQKVNNLPVMHRRGTDTSRIGDVLEHLARFMMVKHLNNEMHAAAFRQSFDIQIFKDGMSFGPEQLIEVRHNRVIEIFMKNKGCTTLYVHVYNLDSRWRVKGILHAAYEAIPPQENPRNGDLFFMGNFAKKVKMTVPHTNTQNGSCEDVIKIFVTSRPTSFEVLEMPAVNELEEPMSVKRGNHTDNHDSEDWVAINFPIRTLL